MIVDKTTGAYWLGDNDIMYIDIPQGIVGVAGVNNASSNTEHMKKMMNGDAKNAKNWLKNSFNTVIRDFRGRPLAIGKKAVHVSRTGSRVQMKNVVILGYDQDRNTVQVRPVGSNKVSNISRIDHLIVI